MDEALAPPTRFPMTHAPDEMTALVEFLDIHRLEFHERAWGLSDEQLRLTVAPSDLTLGRLLKHMALVEHSWFEHRFLGLDPIEPWASAPWDDDPNWELTSADDHTGEELFTMYVDACNRSRAVVVGADSLDQLTDAVDSDGNRWNLRWILVHMIEEYARHCGHADLIRESIDGVTG